jgi:hypothetical protein
MDLTYELSPHFKWQEMTITEIRPLQDENRALAAGVVLALQKLCIDLLEPVREARGPMIVHSGYRCPNLNKLIGGSPTSQHCFGMACDFNVLNRLDPASIEEDFNWIWKQSRLQWHQLIFENNWIHIALPTGDHDQQVMTFQNGVYTHLA